MDRQTGLRSVLLICLGLLLAAGTAGADDRVLLRATGAPANVLVILDSGASMTHDPESNSLNFLAAGDDRGYYTDFMVDTYGQSYLENDLLGAEYRISLNRGSKLHQAKAALRAFFAAGFDFNYGFSYYEKTAISVHHLNFIYRVAAEIDTDGDGTLDTAQTAMLDGTPVGGPMRFGDITDVRNTHAAAPFFPVRFGIDGTDQYILWDDGVGVAIPAAGGRTLYHGTWTPVEPNTFSNGDRKLVAYLVNGPDLITAVDLSAMTAAQRVTERMYYYPAYSWSLLDSHYQNGMKGTSDWATIAQTHGFPSPTEQDLLSFRNQVLTALDAIQIGSRRLFIREDVYEYDRVAYGGWSPAPVESKITAVEWQQDFVLYDHESTESNPGTETLSAVDYQGTADCAGYLDPAGQGIPTVPLDVPEPSTGATVSQRWKIETYLDDQTRPVFYFPNGTSGKFLPAVRENFLPFTETVIAIGRRPIKDSINEAKSYFDGDVADWDDPLANCRMNFVLLITDGVETCSNLTAPCSAAANIAPTPVYVIYFGSEVAAESDDETVIKCVGEESGGDYYRAANQHELLAALFKIAMDIEERTRGFASPIVPSVETTTRQTAYISTFTPKQSRSIWRGHLRAYPINADTGVIENLRADGSPNPSMSSWDVGDTLATRDAATRLMYYGNQTTTGTGSAGDQAGVPGVRDTFIYDATDSSPALDKRARLGGLILNVPYASWTDINGDEYPENLKALEETINFIRGVQMVRTDAGVVTTYGRDPDTYGWCGRVFDYDESDPTSQEPCNVDGATLLGVEKLGDIFHSTPQLLAAPACYTCYHHNHWGYRDHRAKHRYRRQVLITGADDGALHAFDAGLWDNDGGTVDGEDRDPEYDKGTGRELFAWVPHSVMPELDSLAYGIDHRWTVDSTATIAEVYIDRNHNGTPTAADREWRTVMIMGQRRGGTSYVCLDVTMPDPVSSVDGVYIPDMPGDVTVTPWTAAATDSRDPICASGSASGCEGPWPQLLWEFNQNGINEDAADGNGADDMGQTWSRPLVGFVKVDADGNSATDAEARMVAIVGGGYSADGLNATDPTGNFIFMIDIETGKSLLKEKVDGMVPADVAALDLNLDGFLETLYWGTTNGKLYRMDVTADGTLDGNGRVDNWTPEVLLEAGINQPFFMRPALVPISFAADGTALLAIAIGSGNRDDIMEPNAELHRFYVVLDDPAATLPILDSQLEPVYASVADSGATDTNLLLDRPGWKLLLGDTDPATPDWEKVNTAAIVLNEFIIFSTFSPESEIEEVVVDGVTLCRRGGNAKTYRVNLYNGNPPEGEERFIQHDTATAMATEPVIYLGADGRLHVIQALDNLVLDEPIEAIDIPLNVVSWKEQ